MFVFTYAAALLAVAYTVTAAVFLLRARGPLTVIFSCYMLSAAGWIGGNAAADVAYTRENLISASQFAFGLGMVNVFFFLILVDVLIDEKLPGSKRILAYALPILAIFFLAFTPYAITDIAFPFGRPAEIMPGFPYTIALVVLLAALVYATIRLARTLTQRIDRIKRLQLLYVFAGLLATLIGQIIFDLLLPLMGETRFYTLGPLTSLFFALGCGHAIARHKFMDLRLTIRTLEQKVEERTREITLLQEEQYRMIVDLSHNLQTPLAVLRCKLERLERSFVHDREVTGISSSVDSISQVITDLLALRNLEEALRVEARRCFSLSALVKDVAEEVMVVAEAEGIRTVIRVAHGIEIVGNEARIREVLMNLAGNAIKYMGSTHPRELCLLLTRTETEAVLQVADTGMGIPADELPQIFGRFYRGSNRVYGDPPGSGLGLSIAARIAKEHDGSIAVESKPGVGSIFTLRLPFRP